MFRFLLWREFETRTTQRYGTEINTNEKSEKNKEMRMRRKKPLRRSNTIFTIGIGGRVPRSYFIDRFASISSLGGRRCASGYTFIRCRMDTRSPMARRIAYDVITHNHTHTHPRAMASHGSYSVLRLNTSVCVCVFLCIVEKSLPSSSTRSLSFRCLWRSFARRITYSSWCRQSPQAFLIALTENENFTKIRQSTRNTFLLKKSYTKNIF